MKSSLSVVSDSLGIVSQLLAIGIEVGIVAGGIYIFKKLTKEEPVTYMPDNQEALAVQSKGPTFKERWDKIGRIFKAVIG